MNMAPPSVGQCTYNARFGNYCHRPGIPEQKGLCYWHSNLPKSREKFLEECSISGNFEGVVIANLDLSNLDLKRAFLRGFTAYHCSFDNSMLSHRWMDMATFEGCNFIKADVSYSTALGAKFRNCIFYKANMQGINLLSADLTGSDFAEANLQDAHIGLAPLILFPGIGNPENHYTIIEKANFKGANFQGVNLDVRYKNAPNLQEPLERVWRNGIRVSLDRCYQAKTNKEKKKTLEELSEAIMNKISGIKVQYTDKRRQNDEIDLIAINQSNELINAGLSGPIFIECKNISEAIGSEVVKKLAGSVPPSGIGIVVTTNKLSSDAEREMRTQISLNSARNLRMAFLDRTDLEQIAEGEKQPTDSIIERYYYVLAL